MAAEALDLSGLRRVDQAETLPEPENFPRLDTSSLRRLDTSGLTPATRTPRFTITGRDYLHTPEARQTVEQLGDIASGIGETIHRVAEPIIRGQQERQEAYGQAFGNKPLGLAKHGLYSAADPTVPIDALFRHVQGGVAYAGKLASQVYQALGGSETWANRLERDINQAPVALMPMDAPHLPPRAETRPLTTAEFVARADAINSPAVADFQFRALSEFGGFTPEQLAGMSPQARAAAFREWTDAGAPRREPQRQLPSPEAAARPVEAPAAPAEPPTVQPPIGATAEPPAAPAAPVDLKVNPPARAAPPPTPSFEDILNDPRSAAEIRADLEAAKNWTPTSEWQPVPRTFGNMVESGPFAGELEFKTEGEKTFARLRPPAGTREAPIEVAGPADLDAVAHLVDPSPTPGQREAENYKMIHGTLGPGLDFSIETAKGGVRTAADGSWSVENFPAYYGRFKGTEGADGDHVDFFYDGPKPFVIDQVDPQTNKFDEHKVVFANDEAHARAIYDAAFTDGSGPARLGAITPMSVDQLRSWLSKGDTKTAIAYAAPKPIAQAPKLPPKPEGPLNIVQFIASKGGLKPDRGGDLKYLGLTSRSRVVVPGMGYRSVIRQGGMDLDRARALAVEAGYLRDMGDVRGTEPETTPNDLLNLIAEAQGVNAERQQERAGEIEQERYGAAEKDVRDAVKEHGFVNVSDEEVRAATESVIRDGADPVEALAEVIERAAIAEERENAHVIESRGPDESQAAAHARPPAPATGAQPAPPVEQPRTAPGKEEGSAPAGVEPRTGEPGAGEKGTIPPLTHAFLKDGRPLEVLATVSPDSLLLQAESDGRLIGSAVFEPNKDGSWTASSVFVEEDYRRNGVASQLYDIAERGGYQLRPQTRPGRLSDDARRFWEQRQRSTERTSVGEQHVLPGAERVSAGEQAQRAADKPLQAKAPQRPADEGLFGDARNQTDLVDLTLVNLRASADKAAAAVARSGSDEDYQIFRRAVREYETAAGKPDALPARMDRAALEELLPKIQTMSDADKERAARWLTDQYRVHEQEGARIAERCLETAGTFSIR